MTSWQPIARKSCDWRRCEGRTARYSARDVRAFGSVGRREADERSDVDFLVEVEPGRSLFDLGALLMDLRDLIGCEVDIVTDDGMHERMRQRVLRDALALEDVA